MEDHPAPDPGEPPVPAPLEPEPAVPVPATAPAATAPPEASEDDPAGEGSEAPISAEDPLVLLAAEASLRRLPAGEEERATRLLKEALLEGRAGVARAVSVLPKLPWLIGVNAVSAAWAEMKPTFRTRLLAGLARVETEAARRVRLSLARGLFKQDVPAALKIAVSVAKDLREKETGFVSNKDAQLFTNVFVGRAKPWVIQLPLGELKPNEAEVVAHVALMAVFALPHAPATQLAILKWCAAAGRLAKPHPLAIEAIKKGLGRWSGKWRQALYQEVKELPEEIAALVAPPARGAVSPASEDDSADEGERPAEELEPAEAPGDGDSDEERERREPPEGAITAETEDAPAPSPRPRPVYESKTVPNQHPRENQREPREPREGREPRDRRGGGQPAGAAFSLPDALRQIDHYVHGLRQELQTAQNKLRQRDDDQRRGRGGGPPARTAAAPVIPGEPSPDELARLNVQLEARNAELQARLDELKEDSEARAASAALAPAETEAVSGAQLKALLQLKLQEDFEDCMALELELPDVVVQQHYRSLLNHVFQVLKQEGVPFVDPPPPPQ